MFQEKQQWVIEEWRPTDSGGEWPEIVFAWLHLVITEASSMSAIYTFLVLETRNVIPTPLLIRIKLVLPLTSKWVLINKVVSVFQCDFCSAFPNSFILWHKWKVLTFAWHLEVTGGDLWVSMWDLLTTFITFLYHIIMMRKMNIKY